MAQNLSMSDRQMAAAQNRLGLLGRRAAHHQPEADIGLDAHPGKQAALLEHHGVLDRPAAGFDGEGACALVVESGKDAQ